MIRLFTKIKNIHSIKLTTGNVNHLFNTNINNMHKYTITAFGATIIYLLQIKNSSKMCNGKIDMGVSARVVIKDKSDYNGNVRNIIHAKAKINTVSLYNDAMDLNLEYTTPLTWSNLLRYDTWGAVKDKFDTWDDVKTYR